MILHDSNVIVTSITGLNEHLIDKSIKTVFFLQKKYVKPMMHDFGRYNNCILQRIPFFYCTAFDDIAFCNTVHSMILHVEYIALDDIALKKAVRSAVSAF